MRTVNSVSNYERQYKNRCQAAKQQHKYKESNLSKKSNVPLGPLQSCFLLLYLQPLVTKQYCGQYFLGTTCHICLLYVFLLLCAQCNWTWCAVSVFAKWYTLCNWLHDFIVSPILISLQGGLYFRDCSCSSYKSVS